MSVPDGSNPAPLADKPLPPAISLQDVIAAVLAISLAVVTLTLLVSCYDSASRDPAAVFAAHKDILNIATSLFSAVTGYYLGRAPAEKQAQQAQQTTKDIQGQLVHQQKQTDDATQAQDHARKSAEAIKNAVVTQLSALVAETASRGTPDAMSVRMESIGGTVPAPPDPVDVPRRLADLLQSISQIS